MRNTVIHLRLCSGYAETCMLSIARNELIAKRLRVLGQPARLRILHVLKRGKRPLTNMVELLGGSRSELSRHLKALCQAGVLDRKQKGPNHQYTIADERVVTLCDLVLRSVAKRIPPQPAALYAVSDKREDRKSHARNAHFNSKRPRAALRK